jgi:hypothetical protein
LDFYFNNKRNSKSKADYVNYYSDIKKESKEDIYKLLNIDRKRPKIGIYPNIPWDGKMFSATKEFPDMNVFIRAILEWAKMNKDVDLIIRAHPAETYKKAEQSLESFLDLIKMECKNLPKNIKYIEPGSSISSYELSKICDVALMYASTLALEFAYNKHPVIQVGLNNVSNKGLIFDAPTKKIMFDYLDKAVQGKLIVNKDMHNRVIKYADYWINKKHIPENLIELDKLQFKDYSFNNTMQLSKGNNKVLDWFIDRCIDGKPFIWEDNV